MGIKYTKKELNAWFACLDGVACEIEADKSNLCKELLINVMDAAGITMKEIQWAKQQCYVALDDCGVLNAYECMLLER